MSPSEVSNSSKFSGNRSNFSQMCNRLSQYLKERGSFGDLQLGSELKQTMDLFPLVENSGQGLESENPNMLAAVRDDTKKNPLPRLVLQNDVASPSETEQMTIFMVFDDFPADKAKDVINLASSKACLAQSPSASAISSDIPPLNSDIPIARKNSLARFLEKRKDRFEQK